MSADPRRRGIVFSLGGWTRSGAFYAYDPATRQARRHEAAAAGPLRQPGEPRVATEVKVKAPDGTLVPLSIVYRKGMKLDGTNPTILYGYGAYGISQTPFFRPT